MPREFLFSAGPNLAYVCPYCSCSFAHDASLHMHGLIFHPFDYYGSEAYNDFIEEHPDLDKTSVTPDFNWKEAADDPSYYQRSSQTTAQAAEKASTSNQSESTVDNQDSVSQASSSSVVNGTASPLPVSPAKRKQVDSLPDNSLPPKKRSKPGGESFARKPDSVEKAAPTGIRLSESGKEDSTDNTAGSPHVVGSVGSTLEDVSFESSSVDSSVEDGSRQSHGKSGNIEKAQDTVSHSAQTKIIEAQESVSEAEGRDRISPVVPPPSVGSVEEGEVRSPEISNSEVSIISPSALPLVPVSEARSRKRASKEREEERRELDNETGSGVGPSPRCGGGKMKESHRNRGTPASKILNRYIMELYKQKAADKEKQRKHHETFQLQINREESMLVFYRTNTDDLLSCLTMKATKTARQCGVDMGDSGLAEANAQPRFRNRKRLGFFETPKHFRDRRDYNRNEEMFWKEEEDKRRDRRRILGAAYDFRVRDMQIRKPTDEAVCMMQNNMHLILWQSCCGDVPISRMEVFKGEANPKSKPDPGKNLFAQTILKSVEYRRQVSEADKQAVRSSKRRKDSVPPPDPTLSSESSRRRTQKRLIPKAQPVLWKRKLSKSPVQSAKRAQSHPRRKGKLREDSQSPSEGRRRETRNRDSRERNRGRSKSRTRLEDPRLKTHGNRVSRKDSRVSLEESSITKYNELNKRETSTNQGAPGVSGQTATLALHDIVTDFPGSNETILPSPTGVPTPEPVFEPEFLPPASTDLTELKTVKQADYSRLITQTCVDPNHYCQTSAAYSSGPYTGSYEAVYQQVYQSNQYTAQEPYRGVYAPMQQQQQQYYQQQYWHQNGILQQYRQPWVPHGQRVRAGMIGPQRFPPRVPQSGAYNQQPQLAANNHYYHSGNR